MQGRAATRRSTCRTLHMWLGPLVHPRQCATSCTRPCPIPMTCLIPHVIADAPSRQAVCASCTRPCPAPMTCFVPHVSTDAPPRQVVCRVLHTAEFCRATLEALGSAIAKDIKPSLADKVGAAAAEQNALMLCSSVWGNTGRRAAKGQRSLLIPPLPGKGGPAVSKSTVPAFPQSHGALGTRDGAPQCT